MSRDPVAAAMARARERWAEHIATVSEPLTRWMLERLELHPGQTVLDIAAGIGDPGLKTAALVAPGGRLICTDISPEAISVARRRARARGITNVRFRVMDGQRMDLPSGSVDRALCRWGYMLMPQPDRALAETRRVVRVGGRLVFAVWGPGDRNPWAGRLRRAVELVGRVEPVDPAGPGGMFSLADEHTIRALAKGVGWRVLEVVEIPLSWRYGDFDEYWSYAWDTAGVLGPILRGLDNAELGEVRRIVEEGSAGFRHGEALVYPALAVGVVAV